MFLEVICLVDVIAVSENGEALIVLASTVAGAATTFVASMPITLEIKFPVVALATNVTGRVLLSGETYDMMEQFCHLYLTLCRSVGE
jgi:hypothetical protein